MIIVSNYKTFYIWWFIRKLIIKWSRFDTVFSSVTDWDDLMCPALLMMGLILFLRYFCVFVLNICALYLNSFYLHDLFTVAVLLHSIKVSQLKTYRKINDKGQRESNRFMPTQVHIWHLPACEVSFLVTLKHHPGRGLSLTWQFAAVFTRLPWMQWDWQTLVFPPAALGGFWSIYIKAQLLYLDASKGSDVTAVTQEKSWSIASPGSTSVIYFGIQGYIFHLGQCTFEKTC